MKANLVVVFLVTAQLNTREASSVSEERIRIVHQRISKWDKNRDGHLTGAEREAFLTQKRKEAAEAEAAARAAKLKGKPPKPYRVRSPLSPEDVGKPIAKGVPKNIEDAQQ